MMGACSSTIFNCSKVGFTGMVDFFVFQGVPSHYEVLPIRNYRSDYHPPFVWPTGKSNPLL